MHDDLVMQIAILIEDECEYKGDSLLDYTCLWDGSLYSEGISKGLDAYKNQTIEYLYFGNEFCEYRIPSVEQLSKMNILCHKEKLKLVLVTPPVSDYGIERVKRLINYISQKNIELDIVVNDVGVLEIIHQRNKKLSLIAGRIFDKTSHDSRATMKAFNQYYGENGMKFAKTPGVISRYAREIYERYGVIRYEFDMPMIGLELPSNGYFSLYWPYNYLTTGRICLLRSMDLKGTNKFLVEEKKCSQPCVKYKVEKRKPINGYGDLCGNRKRELLLTQKGNTVFYLNDSCSCDLSSFDRLVVQL